MSSGGFRAKWAILVAIVAMAIGLALWELGGLRGEVFLVSTDGAVSAAPGAEIWVVRTSQKKSWVGLVRNYSVAVQRALPKAAGSPDETVRALEAACRTFFPYGIIDYLGPPTTTTTADRDGRFSTSLLPGRYIIWASGQAGTSHADWIEEVHVYWRSYARLASPQSQYTPE